MDLGYEDTTTMNTLHRIRHPWRIAAIALAAIVIVLAALAAAVPFRSDTARRKVVEVLAARLDAEVELADLRLRVLPWFRAEGHGLAIRHKGRRDVPPLIAIERFSADGNPFDLLRKHIARVTVEGLDIEIPPDHNRDNSESQETSATPSSKGAPSYAPSRTFVVDELLRREPAW
jgi:uncharacterized protein involved in outer membrane biogenesis